MAQIDIKEAEVRFYDGTLGTCTLDSVPSDSDMVFTAKSKHIGRDKISITFVDPGSATQSLAATISERDISVSLATDGSSALISTAAEVKAAIVAVTAANALVTITLETVGAGVVKAFTITTLDGQLYTAVKIGEGTISHSEKKPRVFTKDRGNLDTVKDDDSEPMDISLDSTWEWLRASSGGTVTFEDAVKQRGEASAWLTTADDACQPYCVDIEIYNAPGCGAVKNEIIIFEEFYYENIEHDLRDSTLVASGRCNREEASIRRVAS